MTDHQEDMRDQQDPENHPVPETKPIRGNNPMAGMHLDRGHERDPGAETHHHLILAQAEITYVMLLRCHPPGDQSAKRVPVIHTLLGEKKIHPHKVLRTPEIFHQERGEAEKGLLQGGKDLEKVLIHPEASMKRKEGSYLDNNLVNQRVVKGGPLEENMIEVPGILENTPEILEIPEMEGIQGITETGVLREGQEILEIGGTQEIVEVLLVIQETLETHEIIEIHVTHVITGIHGMAETLGILEALVTLETQGEEVENHRVIPAGEMLPDKATVAHREEGKVMVPQEGKVMVLQDGKVMALHHEDEVKDVERGGIQVRPGEESHPVLLPRVSLVMNGHHQDSKNLNPHLNKIQASQEIKNQINNGTKISIGPGTKLIRKG